MFVWTAYYLNNYIFKSKFNFKMPPLSIMEKTLLSVNSSFAFIVCLHCLLPIPTAIPVIMCRTLSAGPTPIPILIPMATVPNLTPIQVGHG